jgi:hypothetical protein
MITESLATDEDIGEFVSKAFHKYPELFALFIWDLSSFPPLEKAVSDAFYYFINRFCYVICLINQLIN